LQRFSTPHVVGCLDQCVASLPALVSSCCCWAHWSARSAPCQRPAGIRMHCLSPGSHACATSLSNSTQFNPNRFLPLPTS